MDYGTPLKTSDEMVTLLIDGRSVQVPLGNSIMAAARLHGIEIPKLCATDNLDAFGSCRVCLVEVDGMRGYPASCTTPVSHQMVVRTESEALTRLRKGMLSLYLSDFPAQDVPDGWSEFHRTLEQAGVTDHPYSTVQNHLQAPIDDSNPYFLFDPAKCIVCNRCVRACEEIQGTFALTIEGRGFDSKVVAGQDQSFFESNCVSCGACVQTCPTQALVEKSLFPEGYQRG
jgi:bidirectional [NiFe] hydrogenase diaphorase subunit